MAKYYVIIPCAGSGNRFASSIPKQYHSLLGKTVLDWTLSVFSQISAIEQIIVVTSPDDIRIDEFAARYPQLRIYKAGGATRAESVTNGLKLLSCQAEDWVLVHDAARCCIRPQDIQNLISSVAQDPCGGILAAQAVDTVKLADHQGYVSKTLDRQLIYLAQTPQMFRYRILLAALSQEKSAAITDEASAVEAMGMPVRLVECGLHNFKLTFAHDLVVAEALLNHFRREDPDV